MKCIHQVSPELLKGLYVLVRVDFNVPLLNGKIIDTTRIEASLKTILYLTNSGARVILISHIGRDSKDSLLPVYTYLKKRLSITFVDSWDNVQINEARESLDNGKVLLLQNLRSHQGEETNNSEFAHMLASLGSIYINDAFSVSHREHASIVEVPKLLKSYCGCQFKKEYTELSKIDNPEHPFIVLIGGAKFETKIPIIKSLLPKADNVFIGGALVNDILKANEYETGVSKVHAIDKGYAYQVWNNKKYIKVVDVKVQYFLFNKNKKITDVSKQDKVIDGGRETAQILCEKIKQAKFIVWNGPFGIFEQGNSFFSKKVIEAIEQSDAYSIVGGGDTVAEIKKLNKEHVFDFVSLAGGAMLEFIARGTLPGIEALK